MSRICRIEILNRLVVAGTQGKQEGRLTANGDRVSFWVDGNALESDYMIVPSFINIKTTKLSILEEYLLVYVKSSYSL